MLCLIGRANVGRLNGYHCYCSSTRASTSFYNGIDKLLSPALLKVSCLPVLPTVQPAGSKQRPPVNPVSARICGCARARALIAGARAHECSRPRARALVHAHSRARAPALTAYALARARALIAGWCRRADHVLVLPAVTFATLSCRSLPAATPCRHSSPPLLATKVRLSVLAAPPRRQGSPLHSRRRSLLAPFSPPLSPRARAQHPTSPRPWGQATHPLACPYSTDALGQSHTVSPSLPLSLPPHCGPPPPARAGLALLRRPAPPAASPSSAGPHRPRTPPCDFAILQSPPTSPSPQLPITAKVSRPLPAALSSPLRFAQHPASHGPSPPLRTSSGPASRAASPLRSGPANRGHLSAAPRPSRSSPPRFAAPTPQPPGQAIRRRSVLPLSASLPLHRACPDPVPLTQTGWY